MFRQLAQLIKDIVWWIGDLPVIIPILLYFFPLWYKKDNSD